MTGGVNSRTSVNGISRGSFLSSDVIVFFKYASHRRMTVEPCALFQQGNALNEISVPLQYSGWGHASARLRGDAVEEDC